MVVPFLNGSPQGWEEHFLPDSSFSYERQPVRVLHVAHRASDEWRFVADGGVAVEVYPPPAPGFQGSFPQPGHFCLLVNGRVEGFVFLDPAESFLPPAGAVDAATLGVLPNQKGLVTGELNAAIQKLSAAGGGVLRLGAGRYESGTVHLQSGVSLFLEAGAVLQASLDLEQHPLDPPFAMPPDFPPSLIPGSRRRFISFFEVEDSGLLGPGVVCGQGSELRRRHPGPRAMMQLVRAVGCRNLRFEGVTLRDSEFWNTHLVHCQNVLFDRVKVLNEIPPPGWDSFLRPGSRSTWNNADGINPDSSQDILIENSFFHTGDDCVPIKNTGCHLDRLADVARVTVRSCLMRTPVTAMKVGTETRGDRMGNIQFEGIHIVEASRPIALDMKDGAVAHSVRFSGIDVRRCNRPFDLWVIPREKQKDQVKFSTIREVQLENIRIGEFGIEGSNQTSHIHGRSSEFSVSGVTVRGLEIGGKRITKPELMDVEINEWASGIDWT
jgi:hypothetical protein